MSCHLIIKYFNTFQNKYYIIQGIITFNAFVLLYVEAACVWEETGVPRENPRRQVSQPHYGKLRHTTNTPTYANQRVM